jgi:branched-chain amino acid transport system ATP-binding protein
MLEITKLNARYGGTTALRNVSFTVQKGKIISILGANGSGKSTLMRSIMGGMTQISGSILFENYEILGKRTEDIVAAGIALVPEGRQVFAELTVYENLYIGAYVRRDKVKIEKDLNTVYELFPKLAERRRQIAATLSGGEQQMLAIGRGLMSNPKLLLLDEPSLGLAPILVTEIMALIQRIQKQGVTILLVEQNARQALGISSLAFVIEKGQITMSGDAKLLAKDPHVVSAYLGGV